MKRKILINFVILLLIILSSCAKKAENTSIPELKDEPAEVVDTDTSAIFPDTIFRDIQISVPLNTDETKKEGVVTEKENHYADDSIKPLLPKMIEIRDEKNNLNIEISETLVTMEQYKSYLTQKDPSRAEYFEIWASDANDGIEFQKEWPMWLLTWRDAAEYCNWLSKEKGFQPVYSKNRYDEFVIDRSANGYRFPYVRELLILSGLKDGLSKEEYESENFCQKKDYPFPVYEGKKNKYGIYDLLGNLPQYCNDYYLNEYDYFDFENNAYGPDYYTDDEEELYYNLTPTPVRCAFGCFCWNTSYDLILERVVIGTLARGKSSFGIRLARSLPVSE